MTRKLLSILLVLVMVFSTLSQNVFATELRKDEQIREIQQMKGEIKDVIERYLVPCDNENVSATYLHELLKNDDGTDKILAADEAAKLEAHLDVCSYCFDSKAEKSNNITDNEENNKPNDTIKDNLIGNGPMPLTTMSLSSDNEFLAPISPRDPDAIAVSTIEELKSIVNPGSYYLTNDIDFDSKSWRVLNKLNGGSITLDGQGHKLLNFKVDDITYSGLFGQINASLTIKNLGIKTTKPGQVLTSSASGYAGSFVGYITNANLTIENCFSDLSVNGTDYSGGMVGVFSGFNNTLTIENCYNLGKIESDRSNTNYAGGIIGAVSAYKNARITNCYNKGEIVNNLCYNAGGILGGLIYDRNDSPLTISNCYNDGNLSSFNAGGILGFVRIDNVVISNCYNTGSVNAISTGSAAGIMSTSTGSTSIVNCYNAGTITSASGSIGAIYSSNTAAAIKNCYYLDTTVATSSNGIPKTNAEMKKQQTFQGFNFSKIWDINSSVNSGYPTLRPNALSNVDFEKIFSISGTITNNGTPLSDISIMLKDKDGLVAFTTSTDENGVYTFLDVLKSEAPYSVMIDSLEYYADDVEITAPGGLGNTIIADIEVIINEIIIPKDEEDYTIKGKVTGAGNNINGLKLIINPTGETVSEKNGVYSHTLRGNTGYTLFASAPGYITQKVDIVFPQDSKELVLDISLQTDTQTANNNFSVNNPHVWLDETLGANPSFLVNVGNGGSSHIIIQSPNSLVGTDVTIKVGDFPAAGLRFDEIDKKNNKVKNKVYFSDGTIKSAEYRFTTEHGTDKINAFSITVIDPKIPRYEIPVYAIYNDKQGVRHEEIIGSIIINIPMSVDLGGQPIFASLTLTGPSTHKTGEGITVSGKVTGDKSKVTIYHVLSNGTEVEINKEPTTALGVSSYSANIKDLQPGLNKLVARTANGTESNYHYIFVKMALQVVVEKLSERTNNPWRTPKEYLARNAWYGVITATESFDMYLQPFFNLTLYFNVENKGEYTPVVSFAGKIREAVLINETSSNGTTVHYYKCDIDDWSTKNVAEMYIYLLDEDKPKIETLAAIIYAQHDPSGYVYDIDAPDERIEGATASLQKLVGDEWKDWVDPGKIQENPQITDIEGKYGWFVEEGTYRVLISKDKYTNIIDKGVTSIANMPDGSFNSDIPNGSEIIVLPPHFDVNVPLKRTEYTVSVDGGTGGGNKAWGKEVTVTADNAPSGQRFKHFTATGLSNTTYTENPLTFTMPDNAVSLSAVFQSNGGDDMYTVTFLTGNGGTAEVLSPNSNGHYSANEVITIKATPSAGYSFVEWLSSDVAFANAASAQTTFNMPAKNVTIQAKFRSNSGGNETYTVTMTGGNGGTAVIEGIGLTGDFEAGEVITIKATPNEKFSFVKWISEDGITFANENKEQTTFVMPAKSVTITAKFAYNGRIDIKPSTKKVGAIDIKFNFDNIKTYEYVLTNLDINSQDIAVQKKIKWKKLSKQDVPGIGATADSTVYIRVYDKKGGNPASDYRKVNIEDISLLKVPSASVKSTSTGIANTTMLTFSKPYDKLEFQLAQNKDALNPNNWLKCPTDAPKPVIPQIEGNLYDLVFFRTFMVDGLSPESQPTKGTKTLVSPAAPIVTGKFSEPDDKGKVTLTLQPASGLDVKTLQYVIADENASVSILTNKKTKWKAVTKNDVSGIVINSGQAVFVRTKSTSTAGFSETTKIDF